MNTNKSFSALLVITLCLAGVPRMLSAQTATQNDQPATHGQPCGCQRQTQLTSQQEIEAEYARIIAELQATNPPELQRVVAELEAFAVGRTDEEVMAEVERRSEVILAQAEAQLQPIMETVAPTLGREISPLTPEDCVRCRSTRSGTCRIQYNASQRTAIGLTILGGIACTGLTRGAVHVCGGLSILALGWLASGNIGNYHACINDISIVCAPFCGFAGLRPTVERR